MDNYIKKLRKYIKVDPTEFDADCNHPALDSLYWHYGESHRMSNDKTKAANRAIREYFGNPVPRKRTQFSA